MHVTAMERFVQLRTACTVQCHFLPTWIAAARTLPTDSATPTHMAGSSMGLHADTDSISCMGHCLQCHRDTTCSWNNLLNHSHSVNRSASGPAVTQTSLMSANVRFRVRIKQYKAPYVHHRDISPPQTGKPSCSSITCCCVHQPHTSEQCAQVIDRSPWMIHTVSKHRPSHCFGNKAAACARSTTGPLLLLLLLLMLLLHTSPCHEVTAVRV